MSSISNITYSLGAKAALTKLGMVSPISHKPRTSREQVNFSADKQENLWQEMDRDTLTTGEESSLGMPSAGGANKNAQADGEYGEVEGPYAQGGFDASQHDPERDKRLSSAMREAFRSNELYDQSYGEEPGMTQPHGAKLGVAGMPGMGSAMKSLNPLTPPKPPGLPKLKSPTDTRGDKPAGMNLQHTVQTGAYADNAAQSIGSPNTRLMGNPV